MNTLYILGGPPRSAKSTIMMSLVAEMGVQFISADAIQHGLRNVLIGEPHQMLRNIEISGSAEYKNSITEGGERKHFSTTGTESELTLFAVVGMLDYYRRNKESVAFEGAAFTPAWVADLKMAGFNVRAAFVGYTDPSHADSIITHAKENPHDWINEWLQIENGDETKIREWVTMQSVVCRTLKSDAESLGYPFFDISTQPFENYLSSVRGYLLQT